MQSILCGALLLALFPCVAAADIVTRSPDGAIKLAVDYERGSLQYSLTVNSKQVVLPTGLSITVDGTRYPTAAAKVSVTRQKIDEVLRPVVPTVRAVIRDQANESLIDFGDGSALRVRAADDGAAFRWETSLKADRVRVDAERFGVNFAGDYLALYPRPNGDGYFSHQENEFVLDRLSRAAGPKDLACVPLLAKVSRSRYLMLTDVNVEEYPGLWVVGGGGTTLTAAFPQFPTEVRLDGDRDLKVATRADHLAETRGTREYPWRAFVVEDEKGLLDSTFCYRLATPSRVAETDWIRPGKGAWDWWNHWNLEGVDFKAGVNQETYKQYIDFASENGLEYVVLDDGWSESGPENLLRVVWTLDMPALVQYGRDKGVGVILWMSSTALEKNFGQAFDQFNQWGVAGIKIDFMQRDDQVMMDFCQRVAAEAAEHRLLVEFHGGSKPTGLQRTYPNVLTHESVLGLEQNKWGDKASSKMAVLLPFTRMVVGPMDYTPGAMDNYQQSSFKPVHESPGSQGTRCQQLAMYVAFVSPLQMLADSPSKYRKNPSSMEFLREVPTTWHDTVVLHAEIGNSLAIARRHEQRWFVGVMTDGSPRELDLDLSFLPSGRYRVRSWEDGPNAGSDATQVVTAETPVAGKDSLKVRMAPGGGYAAIIEPL
ncbi:MAG: glycoside hydrolase family 97 protein [Lacipirellulaceae bacterium]